MYVFLYLYGRSSYAFFTPNTYFYISFFSSGFVFIQTVETSHGVTGVKIGRSTITSTNRHSALLSSRVPDYSSTSYHVPSKNLGHCFPSCICKRLSFIDRSAGTSNMHLKKGHISKNCSPSVVKLLFRIFSFSHLVIVSFLNTRAFSKLFKLYLTAEEKLDTEKDAEQFGEIMGVCCYIHTASKCISTLCMQNAEFLTITEGSAYSYHWAL
jgi:hypothetical protein